MVLDKWREALDKGLAIDCIYMDFQKAFDTVPHKRLQGKWKTYGISWELNRMDQELHFWKDPTSGGGRRMLKLDTSNLGHPSGISPTYH